MTSQPTTELAADGITPPIWARALIGGATAAVINLVILLIGHAAGASMTMTEPQPATIEWPAVIAASIAPLAIAGLVTWLAAKRWPRVRGWFAWTGLAVAVLSCAALISSPDVATAVSLGAMHIVAGIAWFIALTMRTSQTGVQ